MEIMKEYKISKRQFFNWINNHHVISVNKHEGDKLKEGTIHVYITYYRCEFKDGTNIRHIWTKGDVVYKNNQVYCVKNKEKGYEYWYVDKDPVVINVKRGK